DTPSRSRSILLLAANATARRAVRGGSTSSPPELLEGRADVGPAEQGDGLVAAAPAVVVVLPVQRGLELGRRLDDEASDRDALGSRWPLRLPLRRLLGGGIAILVAHRPEAAGRIE